MDEQLIDPFAKIKRLESILPVANFSLTEEIFSAELINEGKTLCTKKLNETVSFYSQFELCEIQPSNSHDFCGDENMITLTDKPLIISPNVNG